MTILAAPDNFLTGEDLIQIGRPHVYAWIRKHECLYIGCSKIGISRLITHHVIKPLPTDNFCFWHDPHDDMSVLKQLELDLIREYQPKYNIVGKYHPPPPAAQRGKNEPDECYPFVRVGTHIIHWTPFPQKDEI